MDTSDVQGLNILFLALIVSYGALLWSVARKHDLALTSSFFAMLLTCWIAGLLVSHTLAQPYKIAQQPPPTWLVIIFFLWMIPASLALSVVSLISANHHISGMKRRKTSPTPESSKG